MNSIPKLPYTNSKGGLKVTDNNNQADGFSVAEKSGSNLIVGKMVKFTIDGKYKADKADTLPDYTTLVPGVTTAWVKWQDGKPVEHRITQPGEVHPTAMIFRIRMKRCGNMASRVSPLTPGGTLVICG